MYVLFPSQYKAHSSDAYPCQGSIFTYPVRSCAMLPSKRLDSTILLNASRLFSQRRLSRNLTENPQFAHKPVFRMHRLQLDRANVREPTSQAPQHNVSATQKWVTSMNSHPVVIPKYLSYVEFPAGEPEPIIRPTGGPIPKRTQEDRRRVEAVLKTPLLPLAKYISPEMLDSIKKSPYYAHDENVIVLRCHQKLKQKTNELQCLTNLRRLIRNVANEIMYRENMANKIEGEMDDSQ